MFVLLIAGAVSRVVLIVTCRCTVSQEPKLPDGELQPTILFIAGDPDEQYGLKTLLEGQGYEVYCRDSRIRAFQLMTVYMIDLVVVDVDLEDGAGVEFCKEFRADQNFSSIPIVLIGADDEEANTCIAAFEAGADDFVQVPFVPAACLLRVKRLISRQLHSRSEVKTSLSVEVSSGELPGILQYLEAEVKTGKLSVKCDKNEKGTAVIFIQEGRFVHATAPIFEGTEAVTEALSWERSQVTFEECEIKPEEVKDKQSLTSVLMNCVVDVDEYREARDTLPPTDAMFRTGSKRPSKEMPRHQRDIHDRLINGHSIDEVLQGHPAGERQATLWLQQLIEEDFLKVTDPPFHQYTLQTFEQYQRLHYKQRLMDLRKVLADIDFPISEDGTRYPMAPTNWISPAARVLLLGDRSERVDMFIESMAKLYRKVCLQEPPEHRGLPGASRMRYDFGDKNVIDIQRLPAVLKQRFLASIDEYLSDTVAIILIAGDQTRRANQTNLRLIRQIRQRFKGVFYFLVPKVMDKEGRSLFKLDCNNCGYRLAVDMDEAGNQGECPICNADLMIPDALDHLAHSLKLPHDVPIVLVEPSNPLHVRDFMMLMLDTILYATNPPLEARQSAEQPEAVARPKTHIAPSPDTETHEQVTDDQAEDEAASELDSIDDPEDDPEDEPSPLADEPLDAIEDILSLDLDELDDQDPDQTDLDPDIDLEDFLQSQDDDFDIDEFIKKVQRD